MVDHGRDALEVRAAVGVALRDGRLAQAIVVGAQFVEVIAARHFVVGEQIAADGALFADMDLEQSAQDEIIAFMDLNKNKLREVSLRMAIKIAQLRKSFPERWTMMARTTCMKP